MRLDHQFTVPVPVEQAWQVLLDLPRVVPCMPGAELVETLGPESWRARMRVRLGPMAMAFDADVERAEADPAARRAVLAVRAREQRGRGGADARVTSSLLAQDGGGTRVRVHTAVTLSGRVAQFGRAAVGDVAAELTDRFAENLRAVLAAAPQAPPAPASGPAPARDAAPSPGPAAAASLSLLTLLRAAARRALRRLLPRRSRA